MAFDLACFATFLTSPAAEGIGASKTLPDELLIGGYENLTAHYAPFEHVNTGARVVLCGITPGMAQARTALAEARRLLLLGADAETAATRAKATASFSGPMRSNLIAMLDEIGLNKILSVDSCARLFDSRGDLVHFTSALRYPVLKSGENYRGVPKITSLPFFRNQLERTLAKELLVLPRGCLLIPLGETPNQALQYLADKGYIDRKQILDGMPHPSPANGERIAYFLGKKDKEALSKQTNGEALDEAKSKLIEKLSRALAN